MNYERYDLTKPILYIVVFRLRQEVKQMSKPNEEIKEAADAVKIDLDEEYESPEAQSGEVAGAGSLLTEVVHSVETLAIATASPNPVLSPDVSICPGVNIMVET